MLPTSFCNCCFEFLKKPKLKNFFDINSVNISFFYCLYMFSMIKLNNKKVTGKIQLNTETMPDRSHKK